MSPLPLELFFGIERIYHALLSQLSSGFAERRGLNLVRFPQLQLFYRFQLVYMSGHCTFIATIR